MKIEIKNRWTSKIIFEMEAASLKIAVEAAVEQKVDMWQADLSDANLNYARLDGASLVGASLVGARLVGARLDGARLDGARLDGASLDGARLVGARLDGASLVGASLVGARLDGASLVGASLGDRLLTSFRDDIWAVCSSAPAEAAGVLKALEEGKVDGSTYEGDCACLVGTIANTRGCRYDGVATLKPNSSRLAEVWFMQIREGNTPANNVAAKQAHAWITEWLTNMRANFAVAA